MLFVYHSYGMPGVEGVEQLLEAVEVSLPQQTRQPDPLLRVSFVVREVPQEVAVQALAHLAVRVAEPVDRFAVHVAVRVLAGDGEVAGLEQQRLGGDVAHVEPRHQLVGRHHALQLERPHPPPQQRVEQEGGRARLEPVRPEPPRAEKQQDVERVVELLRAEPRVAVVPFADAPAVEARQLRREHRVQVRLRVAADRRILRVEGDVGEVVQPGEQTHLGELAHPRDETEAEVRVAVLDHRVEAAQVVPVGACEVRVLQRVEYRLVVLGRSARPRAGRSGGAVPRHGMPGARAPRDDRRPGRTAPRAGPSAPRSSGARRPAP